MIRLLGALGAVYGLLAVGVGAFAAHALESRLDERALGWIETGARYQFFHALALVAVLALDRAAAGAPGALRAAAVSFAVGIVLFSGSLYLMAAGGPRWLGAVTPVGGVLLMIGWAALALAAWRLAG